MKEFVLQFDGTAAEEAAFVSALWARAQELIGEKRLGIRLGHHGVIGAWAPPGDEDGADITMANNRVLRSDIPPSTANRI